jgi:tRNA (adenine57-N1/adenine58-N1)-methyltransferase
MQRIEKGDTVMLLISGKKYLVTVQGEGQKVSGLGMLDTSRLIGRDYGECIDFAGAELRVLPPNITDLHQSIRRKAQVILPKDCAQIIFNCDIKAGSIVVEGGCGSGALTTVLAHFVSPGGRVHSIDIREDFLHHAEKNLKMAGLNQHVEFKLGDVTKEIGVKDADTVILDMPNPWDVVANAYAALRPGGMLATYSPNINQVERACSAMAASGFSDIRTTELLEREMVVRDGMTRPSFDMLGHTGYLTFARKTR